MIWLVQYLCPARHCIIAAAYDDKEETFENVCKLMQERLLDLKADPFCGICGSTVLAFEQAPTKFESITQALPILRIAEQSNLATRALLDAQGASYKHLSKQ